MELGNKKIDRSLMVQKLTQDDNFSCSLIKARKFSLQESGNQVDPDCHIVSKQSIKKFGMWNGNMMLGSKENGKKSESQQNEERNEIEYEQNEGKNNEGSGEESERMEVKKFLQSDICIGGSELYGNEYGKGQLEGERGNKNERIVSKMSKLSSGSRIREQNKCSKVGFESIITIEVQDQNQIPTNRATYFNSSVEVDLGATDKTIYEYYHRESVLE